jgi:general bacterial porin, GBP family
MNQSKRIKVSLTSLLCALALMPLTVMAGSGSSVTLYGILDLGLYYNHVSSSAGSLNGAVSSSQAGIASGVLYGSRWGLKGTERISEQWSIDFKLESGINANDGSQAQGGLAFGRQSTLAISNTTLGSLQFGRAPNFAYSWLGAIDPFPIGGAQAQMGASFGSANSVRPNNMALYQTNDYNGFQAGIGYSFNTGFSATYANSPGTGQQSGTQYFGTTTNMRMITAAVRYASGPVKLLATFDTVYPASKVVNSSGQTVANQTDAVPQTWFLAGSYDLKVATLSAAFGQSFDGAFFGNTAGAGGYSTPLQTSSAGANILFAQGAKYNSYAVGAVVPTGADSNVLLSWQAMQPYGNLYTDSGLATQSIFSAAYVYNLSKRTELYVWGSYGNNFQTVSTAKSSVIGAGMVHFF